MNVNIILKNLRGFIASPVILKKTFLRKMLSRIIRRDSVWHGNYTESLIFLNQTFLLNGYYCSPYAIDVCKKYMAHYYNFLGTGWTNWNSSQDSDSDGYIKIDWCRDVVTDYKYTDQRYNSHTLKKASAGTDIKRIWELGRLNHLPYMSLVAINNMELFVDVFTEVRKQISDMIGHSPVGVGAQYYCPMDVGIRCVNILLTKDILQSVQEPGKEQADLFWQEANEYILNQLVFILNNLEYNFADRFGGNHLLCDISSALFICAHFSGERIDGIYKQLKLLFYKNIDRQFLENGANFECSSCYHRFTSEMLLLGLLSIQIRGGEIDEKFEKAMLRLNGAKELLKLLTGADGNIIQIGDNDSGFVLKICPDYKGDIENTLGTRSVIGAIASFCGEEESEENIQERLGYSLVQAYISEERTSLTKIKNKKIITPDLLDGELYKEKEKIKFFVENADYRKNTSFSTDVLGEYMSVEENSEFGIIRIKYENGDVFVRSTIDYNRMFLGHAHDDIFHFEIVTSLGRKHPDCGSVSYTGDPAVRYLYAGSEKHNTVIHKEPLLERKDMFAAKSDYHGFTLIIDHAVYMVAKCSYTHVRRININNGFIMIDDASNDPFKMSEGTNEYSYGYGNIIEVDKNELR